MRGMTGEGGLTELRRGVLGPCVLALLELRPSEWRDEVDERPRRCYSITEAGRQSLTASRAGWAWLTATVGGVLNHTAVRP
jgi:PadR family transcriptional regulator, regulatory protein PadR